MKLGLVAYAENTGLGSQTKAYFDNLQPHRTLVLDRSGSRDNTFYPERFPGAQVASSLPSEAECRQFLADIDVLLIAEVVPTGTMVRLARKNGIKVVLVPNYEYYKPTGATSNDAKWDVDLLLLPSKWHYDDFPEPKMYFPMPITLHRVEFTRKLAKNFLHIAGRPIFPDRNGTQTVLDALPDIQADVRITIMAGQVSPKEIVKWKSSAKLNCELRIVTHELLNCDELYADQDVLLMPRRFGGLCLPVNEAIGHGMPVVMSDISPNNQWLPKQWLITAEHMGTRELAHTIDLYDTDPKKLAKMINAFASNEDWVQESRIVAAQMAHDYSWERLGPKLLDVLQSVVS